MADAQQATRLMQVAQRRLQQLDRHLAQLEQSMEELHTAIATLEGLTGDAALQTLVPIGAGVRVPASIDGSVQVSMDVGAGYSTMMTPKDALEKLRERLANTESAFRATSDEADKTAQRFQDLQMQAMASSS